ncbi:TonB family protein [Brevundimonas olei]|uniref:TonB family protein n=1 Tax=Brevundimonas olei TaxID=657642 RepID=UPI0031DE6C24
MIPSARFGFALGALMIVSGGVALPSATLAQDADQALPPPRWSVPPQASVDDFPEAALQADASGAAVIASDDGADAAPRRFAVRVPFNLSPEPPPTETAATFANVEARWLTPPRPTASDYPQRAVDRGLSGGAAVRCEVALSGKPTNCAVVAEVPPGSGFGEAAVKIVRRGRLNPATIRPEEVGSAFVVTVPFSIH